MLYADVASRRTVVVRSSPSVRRIRNCLSSVVLALSRPDVLIQEVYAVECSSASVHADIDPTQRLRLAP